MKNIIAFIFLLLCCSRVLSAQNLVPNPSFDEGPLIPNTWDLLEYATHWRNPTSATPDYMHEDCEELTDPYRAKAPSNYWGWQYPLTGKGYLAMHSYIKDKITEIEYAQVTLIDTLKINREYSVNAWVSRSDNSSHSTNCQGFLFTEYDFLGGGVITSLPQVNNLEVIRDTQNWIQIGGEFVSDKNYKVLTLGNFHGEAPPFQVEEGLGWTGTATYYWDDISVQLINREAVFMFEILGTCLPATVKLNGIQFSENDDLTWVWNDGKTQKGLAIERIFEESDTFSITLTITHNGVPYSTEKEIVIDMPLAPIADFDIEEKQRGMKHDLHFLNLSENVTQWHWDFGDGSTSINESPVHAFDNVGDYHIKLVASNELGCADSTSQDFYIACADRIFFNAITPNGDGQNEVLPFDRLSICDGPFSIKVFNRWGNLVYESDDPSQPWRPDGVPSGTYYYLISYRGGREDGYIDVIK